jgi:hypothetical protein
LTIVVIGLNEAASLPACFESIRRADLGGLPHEILYADGGSTDNSMALAEADGVDRILGGDQRRRAAENRNLGLQAARGEFIQFLDGDMTLHPGWIPAGLALLAEHPEVATVWGQLQEARTSRYYQALGLDWEFAEGPTRYCGGAALFRTDMLREAGGFPEDIAYGEEPYLCWRLRNEFGRVIWHLHRPMAGHDLDYGGFGDYVRRNIRCGETFAEVAARCWRTSDPLWRGEVVNNIAWALLLLTAFGALLVGDETLRLTAIAFLAAIFGRKFFQYLLKGRRPDIALIYALHTYASKLMIAWGIVKWRLRSARRA